MATTNRYTAEASCPDCGAVRTISKYRPHARCYSCAARRRNLRHGMSRSRLYRIFNNMHSRVAGEDEAGKTYYLARGITVCDAWSTFDPFMAWALANGYDDTLTLDRIDNDGNYSPENCRWVSHTENCRNTRRNRMVSAFGRTQCLAAWAEELGMAQGTLHSRVIRRGMTIEEAIAWTPPRRNRSAGGNADIPAAVQ